MIQARALLFFVVVVVVVVVVLRLVFLKVCSERIVVHMDSVTGGERVVLVFLGKPTYIFLVCCDRELALISVLLY